MGRKDTYKTGRYCRRKIEGKLEENQELMRKLSNKFSIEQIAEMLEIDISEVENIIKELAK